MSKGFFDNISVRGGALSCACCLALLGTSSAADAARGRSVDLDYPKEALDRGIEGKARFRALIGPNGRAKSCQIVKSSGSDILDEATCLKIINRGRFKPSRNEYGEEVDGWFESTLTWQID